MGQDASKGHSTHIHLHIEADLHVYLESETGCVCVSLSLRASQIHQVQQTALNLGYRLLGLLYSEESQGREGEGVRERERRKGAERGSNRKERGRKGEGV